MVEKMVPLDKKIVLPSAFTVKNHGIFAILPHCIAFAKRRPTLSFTQWSLKKCV